MMTSKLFGTYIDNFKCLNQKVGDWSRHGIAIVRLFAFLIWRFIPHERLARVVQVSSIAFLALVHRNHVLWSIVLLFRAFIFRLTLRITQRVGPIGDHERFWPLILGFWRVFGASLRLNFALIFCLFLWILCTWLLYFPENSSCSGLFGVYCHWISRSAILIRIHLSVGPSWLIRNSLESATFV